MAWAGMFWEKESVSRSHWSLLTGDFTGHCHGLALPLASQVLAGKRSLLGRYLA